MANLKLSDYIYALKRGASVDVDISFNNITTTGDSTLGDAAGDVTTINGLEVTATTGSVGAADEAIPLTGTIVEITSDADGTAHALADGTEGQHLYLVLITDGGGDAVVTPANFGQGTTLTFADAGDACHLLFTNGNWYVVGNQGVAIA